jgi:hypothetical protein
MNLKKIKKNIKSTSQILNSIHKIEIIILKINLNF